MSILKKTDFNKLLRNRVLFSRENLFFQQFNSSFVMIKAVFLYIRFGIT
ncbi:hypothetical protein HMPREF0204_11160 [Chryseobacterium gleum ATCC 35910]|uniref:Uncharacterized protein n=1 Tax=Chryseobacterium gleum ATCC 35910 TaxID=525257 RepID=A0ABN0AW16_CHRGE|nr:hypothetical protein HMPREF0204_11160 [Chryseobacterium gleum ATCC 35910]